MENKIKIIIADDNKGFCDLLLKYFKKYEDVEVLAIAYTDEEEIKQGLGYTVLTRTLQSLKAFMRYYDPSITEDVLTMFSEVVQDTYKRFGIDFDTDFFRGDRKKAFVKIHIISASCHLFMHPFRHIVYRFID